MSITTVAEEVATEDAAPTEAPFKISAVLTKDILTFKLKVTASSPIRAIRARFKPLNRNSGQLVYSRGMVCGSGDRCGSPNARSLLAESPHTTETITLSESDIAGEADGEYEIRAWALSEADGWSS